MSLSLADKTKIKKEANMHCNELLKKICYYIRIYNKRELPVTIERLNTLYNNMEKLSDDELCTHTLATEDGNNYKLLITPFVAGAMIKLAEALNVERLDLQIVNNNTDVFYKTFYPLFLDKALKGYIFKRDVKIIKGGKYNQQ